MKVKKYCFIFIFHFITYSNSFFFLVKYHLNIDKIKYKLL